MTIQSEIQALKCADCARSDSAVSDLQPDSLLPIPADALSGWRDGTPGLARASRAASCCATACSASRPCTGRRSSRSRRSGSRRSRRRPSRCGKSIVVIYLNGGNDGLNCFVPHERTGVRQVPDAAARPSPASLGDGTGAARSARRSCPARAARSAFSNKLVSGTGADRNGDTKGFDTLYGDGTGGAGLGSRDHPGGRLQPAQPLALREPRLLVRRRARAAADRLARPLARHLRLAGRTRCRRSRSTPACPSRSAPSKAPVCALEGLQGVGFTRARRHRRRQQRGRQARRRAGRGRATTRSPARAACGASRSTWPTASRALTGGAPGAGYPPNSGLSQKLQLAATLLSAGPRHARHHDRLGQLRHARRPARRAGSAAHDALARAGRVQGRPGDARHRAERRHDGVLRVRPAPRGVRLGGTDHGSGGPIMLSGSAVKGGLAGEHPGVNVNQDGDLVVKTDFRTVYQSLITEWLGGDPNAILPGGPFPGVAALRRRHDAHEGRVGTRLAMARRPTLLALLLLALAAAPGVAGSAGERIHRLHVPPRRSRSCRSRSRSTSSNGACAARTSRSRPASCASTSTTAAWTITTSRWSTRTGRCTACRSPRARTPCSTPIVAAGPVQACSARSSPARPTPTWTRAWSSTSQLA